MLYIREIFGNIFIKWNNRNTMTFIDDLSHTWHLLFIHQLYYFIFPLQQPSEEGAIVNPILPMEKLRPREVHLYNLLKVM